MNNKKGGFGAKLALILILMIASAIGGAYGYRVLDGKMAVRDAQKAIEDVDVSDYDTAERTVVQDYIDEATRDLETAKTRKEVYEIIAEFISDVDKVKTANEKALEEALKAAEEAREEARNAANQNSTTDNTSTNTDNESSGYKSNDLTDAQTDDDDSGFLGSLLGGLVSGS